eukprot:3723731-Rhodomonas_salina.1
MYRHSAARCSRCIWNASNLCNLEPPCLGRTTGWSTRRLEDIGIEADLRAGVGSQLLGYECLGRNVEL